MYHSFKIKSNKEPAHYLGMRIDKFLLEEKEKMEKMTEEKFKELVQSVRTECHKKH